MTILFCSSGFNSSGSSIFGGSSVFGASGNTSGNLFQTPGIYLHSLNIDFNQYNIQNYDTLNVLSQIWETCHFILLTCSISVDIHLKYAYDYKNLMCVRMCR